MPNKTTNKFRICTASMKNAFDYYVEKFDWSNHLPKISFDQYLFEYHEIEKQRTEKLKQILSKP